MQGYEFILALVSQTHGIIQNAVYHDYEILQYKPQYITASQPQPT